jgi:molecular chaperone Hsp33
MKMRDSISVFLFEALDIRGSIVQLGDTWKAIQAQRNYPAQVGTLVGQMCAISVLIAASLKQPGRLTFQLSGTGSVPLLVVDCNEALNVRGFAKYGAATSSAIGDLLGDGKLLMSLDTPDAPQPYQSYVPIEGSTLAEVFQSYLTRSEQQSTALLLVADENTAAGLLLQKLPDADQKDPDGWNRITLLAQTLKENEILGLDASTVLERLFPEEIVRLYPPKHVQHDFPQDREKVGSMLRALGRQEILELIQTHGEIVVTDDLSNHVYRFSPEEAMALLEINKLH